MYGKYMYHNVIFKINTKNVSKNYIKSSSYFTTNKNGRDVELCKIKIHFHVLSNTYNNRLKS